MILQDDVITIPITHEMKLEALEQEKLIESQKVKSKETRNLNSRKNFYGALGEIVVRTYFEECEIPATFPQYFDKDISRDECDFMHRGEKIDIKTSPGNSTLNGFLFVNCKQKDKKVDQYCFVKIDKERQEANIMGIISYDDFYSYSHVKNTPRMKSPAYAINTDLLEPFRNFVYGI